MADESAMVVIQCTCGQRMKVPADAKGKVFKCVRCAEPVRFTGKGAPAAPPRPAPEQAADRPEPKRSESPAPQSAPPQGSPGGGSVVSGEESPTLKRVGELLMEEGIITQGQLDEALGMQKKRGGKTIEILIELGYLDKEILHSFLSKQSRVPSIQLSCFQMDRDLVQLVPRELAIDRYVLPIARLGKLLTVAMACPLDSATIMQIEELSGLRVKAMLCKLDEIQAAIKKYYPAEREDEAVFELGLIPSSAGRENENLGEKVSKIESLSVPNDLLTKIRELGRPNGAPLANVAEAAALDPALSAMLLSVANSAAYGLTGRVDSVGMAVALLGREGVAAVCGRCEAGGDEVEVAWRERAVRCGWIASGLASATTFAGPSVAYTAGLLHELGRFAMYTASPQRYGAIEPALSGELLSQEEEQMFSLTHSEAGSSLAARWHLPNSLYEAIRFYLMPDEAAQTPQLVRIVSVAARLSAAGSELEPSELEPCAKALAHLELDAAAAIDVARRVGMN